MATVYPRPSPEQPTRSLLGDLKDQKQEQTQSHAQRLQRIEMALTSAAAAAGNERVWAGPVGGSSGSGGSKTTIELGAVGDKMFQPAHAANLQQPPAEFANKQLKAILKRQKAEIDLINGSLKQLHDSMKVIHVKEKNDKPLERNQLYLSVQEIGNVEKPTSELLHISQKKIQDNEIDKVEKLTQSKIFILKLEDLQTMHSIEKLTYLSANLPNVPLTHIHKECLPNYFNYRKLLAELHLIKAQLEFKEKTLAEVLKVSSVNKIDSRRATEALNTSIKAGLLALNELKTVSDYYFNKDSLEKELADLKQRSENKQATASQGNSGKHELEFTSLMSLATTATPETNTRAIGPVSTQSAQKESRVHLATETQRLNTEIERYENLIFDLQNKTRMENDRELSLKSIFQFDKVRDEIQDAASCCFGL